MKRRKKIPRFKTEDAERRFWATHDTLDYVDLKQGKRMRFSSLKPTLKTISIRLPEYLIRDLKMLANEQDVPYQSLIKIFLSDRLKNEWRIRRAASGRRDARIKGHF